MSAFLRLTNLEDGKSILVNTARNDFIKQDPEGRAVFINKSQPDLTVQETFEEVSCKLFLKL